MADNNKTCYVCGKAYRYCPNCGEFANAPTWLNLYDDEECKTIDDTLNAFWFGHLTKDEANEKLKGIDLGKITNQNLLVAVKKLKDDDKKVQKKKTTDGE